MVGKHYVILVFLVILAITMGFISGIRVSRRPFCELDSCDNNGYIKVRNVNEIINYTNDLIDIFNVCMNESVEPLPYYVNIEEDV